MTRLTVKEIDQLNKINTKTKAMKLGDRLSEMEVAAATPVNAVNAGKVLTASGVVVDGETLTINNPAIAGTDVYEFLADTAQTKTAPANIAVDITANTTKAARVLTVDTNPTATNTMTIGTKVFTFVANADADGEIEIGTDVAATQVNIVAAINGADEINDPHPLVSAADFNTNACTITALVGGVAGNAIPTTETFTAGTNIFAGATLTGGADCSAANAITALVAAITAHDTQGVGAADGDGDTVNLTADVAGVIGNAIAIAESMANGAFAGAATVLSGGVNGTVGSLNQVMVDASYVYRCVADNTTAGKNWRRVSLGSAF